MAMRKIGTDKRPLIWLNEYPFGEITKVTSYLEWSFESPTQFSEKITRATIRHHGGHESDSLIGAEFVPDDSHLLKIRVPMSGKIVTNPQYSTGYELDDEIAEKIMTELVMLVYSQNKRILNLGSGTLNITGTGYHFSFSRGYITLPKLLTTILPLLWHDTNELSDEEILWRRQQNTEAISESHLFKYLVTALSDKFAFVRAEAVRQLADLNYMGTSQTLLDLLQNDDALIAPVAEALGAIGEQEAVEPLIDIFIQDDLSDDIIGEIAIALGKLGDEKAIQPLIEKLKITTSNHSMHSIIMTLGTLKSDEAVPLLMRIALEENTEREVKHRTLTALGEIGNPMALEVLEQDTLLKHSDKWISHKALEAISEIGSISNIDILVNMVLEEDDDYHRNTIIRVIGQLGGDVPPIWDLLISDLKKSGNKQKYSVAKMMIALNAEQAETILLDYLSTLDMHDEISKTAVVSALVKIDANRYFHLIEQECQTGSYEKRRSLINTIGKLNYPKALTVLLKIMNNTNEDTKIRIHAVDAIGGIGSQDATLDLIATLDDVNSDFVGKVIYALGKIHDERAIPRLIDLLDDNRPSYYHNFYVWTWAEGALRKFDRPDVMDALNLAFKKRNQLDTNE